MLARYPEKMSHWEHREGLKFSRTRVFIDKVSPSVAMLELCCQKGPEGRGKESRANDPGGRPSPVGKERSPIWRRTPSHVDFLFQS